MAQQSNTPQQHASTQPTEQTTPGAPDVAGTGAAAAGADRARQHSSDLDGLLDEIDSVLEANAEDFVKGFVQKGGQ